MRRNCLLSHIIERKIIRTRRRGKRRKQLLHDLKEARRYWKLKEEAQDRTLWRTQFGRGYEPVSRQNTTRLELNLINIYLLSDILLARRGTSTLLATTFPLFLDKYILTYLFELTHNIPVLLDSTVGSTTSFGSVG
jgi:hypothetical protein